MKKKTLLILLAGIVFIPAFVFYLPMITALVYNNKMYLLGMTVSWIPGLILFCILTYIFKILDEKYPLL